MHVLRFGGNTLRGEMERYVVEQLVEGVFQAEDLDALPPETQVRVAQEAFTRMYEGIRAVFDEIVDVQPGDRRTYYRSNARSHYIRRLEEVIDALATPADYWVVLEAMWNRNPRGMNIIRASDRYRDELTEGIEFRLNSDPATWDYGLVFITNGTSVGPKIRWPLWMCCLTIFSL